jgi:hypothetical protein
MPESIPLRGKDVPKDEQHICPTATAEHQPVAGKTFIIRTRKEPHLALTLRGGVLVLLPEIIPGNGAFWNCYKKDGWYGFENSVSGTYLGHENDDKIHAKTFNHKSHEYFMVDRHINGGYILLLGSHNNRQYYDEEGSDNNLMQVAISEDGKWLVQKKEEGIAWDFIDIKHTRCSMELEYPGMEPESLF